ASGSNDMTVKLWDTATGSERATLKGHSKEVLCVAFSADGKTLATGSNDRTVKLWDVGTGTERTTLKGHAGWVSSVAFSPDGKTLASVGGGYDAQNKPLPGEVKLWDLTTGAEGAALKGHNGWVTSVTFSPDGNTLASGSRDGTVKLWDVPMRTERASLKEHS